MLQNIYIIGIIIRFSIILFIILIYNVIVSFEFIFKLKSIESFIGFNINNKIIKHDFKVLHDILNAPKISIIIALFNGEGYINSVISSIQNQNFLFWELIIIDDYSSDNSINLINRLMINEKRIKLLQNLKNMGTLYTKMRGILFAKGKYILSLDQDDLYTSRKVFSFLYNQAEEKKLELLGFSSIISPLDMTKYNKTINYFDSSILSKPNIKDRFFDPPNNAERSSTFLCLYFIRAQLFQRLIKKIDNKFFSRNIDSHDDTILMFLLSREANSLLHIKKIFHVILIWPNYRIPSISHQMKIKLLMREKKRCYSYLTFIEITLLYTEQNKKDKEFAGKILLLYFLEHECRNNKYIIKEAIRICNLFFQNKFISLSLKKKIKKFFREINLSNISHIN